MSEQICTAGRISIKLFSSKGWVGKFAFSILIILQFHMNFRMDVSISAEKKKGSWDFDRNCIEYVDQFGSVALLTILSAIP